MTEEMQRDRSNDTVLQNLLDRLRGPCIPYEFGDRLAEESVQKYFPKW